MSSKLVSVLLLKLEAAATSSQSMHEDEATKYKIKGQKNNQPRFKRTGLCPALFFFFFLLLQLRRLFYSGLIKAPGQKTVPASAFSEETGFCPWEGERRASRVTRGGLPTSLKNDRQTEVVIRENIFSSKGKHLLSEISL